MRMRSKDEWNDDWDDEDVVVKKEPRGPGVLSTRRILWSLVAVAIVAVVVGSLVARDTFQFKEAPPQLLGMWTCSDPERSDLWLEFRREFVEFGTGGTGTVKYRILGVKFDQVGEISRYDVFYRDLAGKEHNREFLLAASNDTLRLADDPGTDWVRYDQ